MIKRVIYDVDGVLLDWAAGFDRWMQGRGHLAVPGKEDRYSISERYRGIDDEEAFELISRFNSSVHYGELPWTAGAHRATGNMRYHFPQAIHTAVTACGLSAHTIMLRVKQLRRLDLDEVRIIGMGEPKDQYFSGGAETLVIEDNMVHLQAAKEAGCLAVAFDQPWNQEWDGLRATNWLDLPGIVREHLGLPEQPEQTQAPGLRRRIELTPEDAAESRKGLKRRERTTTVKRPRKDLPKRTSA